MNVNLACINEDLETRKHKNLRPVTQVVDTVMVFFFCAVGTPIRQNVLQTTEDQREQIG
jgi:hypothetical protein